MGTDMTAGRAKTDWKQVATTEDPEYVRGAIVRATQGWGTALIVWGVFQLIRGGEFDPVWGAVMILTGALSFLFRSAAMLPVYGVLFSWAMINNLFSGSAIWIVAGVVQAFLAFITFRQFVLLRRGAARVSIGLGAGPAEASRDRATAVFPWSGCGFIALAALGLVGVCVGAAVVEATGGPGSSDKALGTAINGCLDVACLGLGMAVAALLARSRFAAVSILAVLGWALLLAAVFVLAILGNAM